MLKSIINWHNWSKSEQVACGSDYLTYLNLLENNHELFALGNLLIMFFPFFFNEFCSLGEKCSLSQLPQR